MENKMMFSEFVNGTKCRDNEHNRKVFENLEVMYMNTEMTKEEIYEYGKKLVDNSKTPAEIEFENEIKLREAGLKAEIREYEEDARQYAAWAKEEGNKDNALFWKNQADWKRTLARRAKESLRELRMMFSF